MITEFIVRTFIKDHKKTEDIRVRSQYGVMEGWISVAINLLLFIVKLVTGLYVNSIALISDAIHSISDMFSSAAVIWGFKMSAVPADKDHPFGHGRMEHIATLIIAVLLIITGFEFFKVAFERIKHPEPVLFSWVAIIIVSFSVIIKEWLAQFSKELGERIDSKTLIGDYLHHRTDAITSLMVLAALLSAKINVKQFDGIAGILISLYIFYSGWKMLMEVVSPLVGESASHEELSHIKSIAMLAKGVKGVHDIIMHKYGNVKIISLHVELPEELPFMEAHNIIEEIEETINLKMNATTTIHLDPVQKLNDDLRDVHTILQSMIKSNPKVDSYHDVRIVKVKGEETLILDIVASDGIAGNEIDKLQKEVISSLKSLFPYFIVKAWVDPKFSAVTSHK